jgi:hypothetical protein
MSFTPILPRVLDALLGGNRGNPLQNAPDPFNDGPDSQPRGLDPSQSLPSGIERQLQMRGLDGLPPGLARQLAQAPAPPAPSPSSLPSPSSFGEKPANVPTTPGQVVTQALGTVASVPAQVLGAVTPAANAGPGNAANAPSTGPEGLPPGAGARGGGSVPVVQPMQQAATATAAQLPAQAQALPAGLRAGAAHPVVPANAVPGTAVAAAPQAASNTTAIPVAARVPEGPMAQAPARADAVPAPVRPEQSVLDRLLTLLRPASDIVRQTLPALVAREAVQQALPLAITPPPLSAPPSQAVAEARVMGVVGNERPSVSRTDTVMAPAYTGTGPTRRGGRLDGFQAMLKRMRLALATGADPRDVRNLRPDHGAWFALQWMFWVLAIVAYGCLGLAMVALLAGSGYGLLQNVDIGRGHYGVAFVGLLAGAGAWWLGRRISRR